MANNSKTLPEKILLTMSGLRLPHDKDLETKILLELIFYETSREYVFARLRKYDFYNKTAQSIYGIYFYFYLKGFNPSIDFIMERLEKMGVDKANYVKLFLGDMHFSMGLDALIKACDTIGALAAQRSLIELGNRVMYRCSMPSTVADISNEIEWFQRSLNRIGGKHEALKYDDITNLEFDPQEPIEQFKPYLKINRGYHSEPVCEKNALVVVTGHEGTGKSYVLNEMVSGLMGGDSKLGFYRGDEYNEIPFVLYIDTEQNKRDFQIACRRIMDKVGDSFFGNFKALRLDTLNPLERLSQTDRYVRKYNPDIIIIDGAADLLEDANNSKESQNLVNTFMRWRTQCNAMVMPVIHLNHGSNKMTGFLGSFLAKKCEVRMRVDKQEIEVGVYEGSKVSNTKNRQIKSFAPIEFVIDKTIKVQQPQQKEELTDNTIPF